METIIRFLQFARPYRTILIIAVFSMVGTAATGVAGPWVIRDLIDTLTVAADQGVAADDAINRLTLILVVLYVLRAFFQFLTRHLTHIAGWGAVADIRERLYEHMQRLSLRFYEDRQTGELMSRTSHDTATFELLIAHVIPETVVNVLLIIGIAIALFAMSPQLALLTLIPVPLLVWLVLDFASRVRPIWRGAQEALAEFNAVLQDNLSGIREIKLFTQERSEHQRIRERAWEYTRWNINAIRHMAIYQPAIELLGGVGTLIVVYFGGRMVLEQGLSLADLVAYLLYLGMFYEPIRHLNQINEQLQQAMAGGERVFEILDESPQITQRPDAVAMRRARGSVSMEGVDFFYVDGEPVLHDISLSVEPGETVALVGPTGAGKTTLVSLIPRFYDPVAGVVRLDGQDLRSLRLTDLRRQVTMVLQDVFLFNGTVWENLTYGNPGASEPAVHAAAEAAHAHEFISRLPDGYETRLGERGVRLSGGQKQRLAIARALLKNAPVLVLDEATSSVDTRTEALIQEALGRLIQNRTTFVIAHRLSTVQDAHRILVLNEGRIVQQGSHDRLMEEGGLYRRLVSVQLVPNETPAAGDDEAVTSA